MEDVIGATQWNKMTIGSGRQCTATSRSGERCRRAPIVGGFVCDMHGGAIPAVRRSARDRLLALVDPVLAAFEEVLASWHATRCDVCGRPTGDPAHVIRVGQLVLDRSGFHPTLTVEQVTPSNPFADMTEDELIEHLERMLGTAKASRDRKQIPTVLDGHLVPEVEQPDPLQHATPRIPVGINTTEGGPGEDEPER